MNNMELLRAYSGLRSKELAKLLNVTAHTYIAFEQGRTTLPNVLQYMLGLIYSIDPCRIIGEPLQDEDIQMVSNLKELSEDERWSAVVRRLFGDTIHVSYHRVRKIKESLLSCIQDDCTKLI